MSGCLRSEQFGVKCQGRDEQRNPGPCGASRMNHGAFPWGELRSVTGTYSRIKQEMHYRPIVVVGCFACSTGRVYNNQARSAARSLTKLIIMVKMK